MYNFYGDELPAELDADEFIGYDDYDYDDSMDGDFDSAMTSAGFGTAEDYGDYGCNEDAMCDSYWD